MGYTDLSRIQSGISLNPNQSEILSNTSGANALKIDSENVNDSETELLNSMVDENMAIDLNNDASSATNSTTEENSISENTMILNNPVEDNTIENQENYNGLENFELRDETPNLFNNEDKENKIEKLDQNLEEEDELEIPAFLRRQKLIVF